MLLTYLLIHVNQGGRPASWPRLTDDLPRLKDRGLGIMALHAKCGVQLKETICNSLIYVYLYSIGS